MSYVIDTVDAITGERNTIKTFSSVALTPDKRMTSQVGGDIATPDTRLYVLADGEPVAEVQEDGEEIPISEEPVGAEAALTGLTLSAGTLTPAFDPLTTAYTASVSYGTSGVTISAAAGEGASVTGGGAKTLAVGANPFDITVTEGGSSKVYTIVITRAASTGGNSLGGGGGGGGGGGSVSAPTASTPAAVQNGESASTPAALWINPFTDVAESAWYYADVEYVSVNNLFNGTSATTFSPGTPMTRGMLVTVLGRLYGADVSAYTTGGFDDVRPGEYYAAYVEWAKQSGIVSGVGGNKFSPDAEITRQDLAAIIQRYAEFAKKQFPVTLQYTAFSDGANIAEYAQNAVQTLYCGGIVSGKPNNLFDPQGSATRAELAAILHRFVEASEG
jgi:hypothetical protein